MENTETSEPVKASKKGMIRFLGILQIFLGLLLIIVDLTMVYALKRIPAGTRAGIIPAMSVYLILTVVTFILAFGMLRIKKWAGYINTALLALLFFSLLLASPYLFYIFHIMNQAGPAATISIIPLAVLLLFMICIPGAVLFAITRRSVVQTFDVCDAKHYPLLKNPMPVFIAELIMIYCIFSFTVLSASPLFGAVYFYGTIAPAASVIGIVLVAVLVYALINVHALKIKGWYALAAAAVFMFGLGVNFSLSFNPNQFMGMYPGVSMEEKQQMAALISRKLMTVISLYCGVIAAGYLFYIKRFFAK